MKVLFVCNQNRSKTAERPFRNRFEVKSAGLYNHSGQGLIEILNSKVNEVKELTL